MSLDGSHREAGDELSLCDPAGHEHGNHGRGGGGRLGDEQVALRGVEGADVDREWRPVAGGEVDDEGEVFSGED